MKYLYCSLFSNKSTKKVIGILIALLIWNLIVAQNSMTGDGFGGRGWYVAHNYSVGAYSAYTVCGESNQLFGWAGNLSGQLGNGTFTSTTTPVASIGMTNVKFYTAGYVSAVIKNDKTGWVWGNQVNFPSGFTSIPTQIISNVKFVDGGISHVAFVKEDGTVAAAGQNKNGELGDGNTSNNPVIVPVIMSGITNAVRAVAVGYNPEIVEERAATVILLSDGTVKITGGGGRFQPTNTTVPVILDGLNNVVDIKGNAIAAYALTADGNVYSFGKDLTEIGLPIPALGLGNTNGNIIPPTKVVFPVGSASIVALSSNNDGDFALALDSNHKVYAWGYNGDGQLGSGTFTDISTPTLVASNVIDIFAGETFSYILKADNTLWATGQSRQTTLYGSFWMNLSNIQRNVFTQLDPTIPPMNLCPPRPYGVVPLQLLSFTCKVFRNTNTLSWTSGEEFNVDKFVIEYCDDGVHFYSIATILAKGSNSIYSYFHQRIKGTAFYRLKVVDKDGSFKYSEIRVTKVDSSAGFSIAPNPSKDILNIFNTSDETISSIQIFSIDGRALEKLNNCRNVQVVNLSNIPKGIYIMKVIFNNNKNEFTKFIKM